MSPDIRHQRWFEAPPDVVFDAYTDPDARNVERNVLHTVERPHRLVYASTTEWPDGSHVESLMEISLQWLDGRTLLTLTQRGVRSGNVERGFTEGWNEFLDGLVARIQTRPAT
jgi:uncharacterized protein YndB with AHSA1/START domain